MPLSLYDLPLHRAPLVKCEDEEVARGLEVVVIDWMQVPTTRLDRDVLFGSNGVGHRGPLQRSPDVKAPQFFKRFIVVGNDPTVLQCREDQAASRRNNS